MKNPVSVSTLCLLFVALACGVSYAQGPAAKPGILTNPNVNNAIHFDISQPLRELVKTQTVLAGEEEDHGVLLPKRALQQGFTASGRPVQQAAAPQIVFLTPTAAAVGVNVLGVGLGFHGYTVPDAPTDSNLAVGDTQVVAWDNVSYAVFNKGDGSYAAGPILGNTLWAGFGGGCETSNSGDIIAQFDKVAHRWVLFQPKFTSPFLSCFAISTSADATGSYYRYSFPQAAGFPDYPKLGIWTNAYYQSNNVFNTALTAYLGAQPCAYERAKMLAGDPAARQVCFLDNSNTTLFDDSMMPADLDSENSLPPVGADEVYLGSIDNFSSETHLYEYVFHVDWTNTANSTFTGVNGAMPISVSGAGPAFVGLCAFGSTACIPQKSTTALLDSLGDRLMYRLAYRRSATAHNNYQSWVISHSIVNGSTGAMRWYEFRAPIATPTALALYQGGTYAPDATYRFMGSLAMDQTGNILMGYSRSSSTLNPDIYFAGRLSTDLPLGTMGGELPIVDQTVATGSQPDTSSRWGDYTSMAIDNDGCTFWYTDQYYTVTTKFSWSTRVASIRFPSCH